MDDNDRKWLRRAGLANSIGMVLVISTGIGGLLGWYLDKHFKTEPIFMLIFGLLGVIAGFVEVFRIVAQINKDEDKDQN